MEASAKFTACPSFQVCDAVCAVNTGAAAGVATENVSDDEAPPRSVAVTLMLRPVAVLATVPVKVPVVLLNDSQDGNAAPFDWVAL